ncbi:hypothetical protein [Geopseudomonas aromaticivorans]
MAILLLGEVARQYRPLEEYPLGQAPAFGIAARALSLGTQYRPELEYPEGQAPSFTIGCCAWAALAAEQHRVRTQARSRLSIMVTPGYATC